MTTYPVNHIEIAASDPNAAAEFYKAVFGWKIEVEETMNYVQFAAEEGGVGHADTNFYRANLRVNRCISLYGIYSSLGGCAQNQSAN